MYIVLQGFGEERGREKKVLKQGDQVHVNFFLVWMKWFFSIMSVNSP